VGQKFCSNCGAQLGDACPNCGAPVAADARFCAECGTQLVAADEQPVQPAPLEAPSPAVDAATSAERRLVSVLFADLVGFTAIAEKRDAEEVRELLTPYFETAREIVGRYGGTVEKFIGDAVMAVWGAPIAHEDDAERAVRAALDLVEAAGSIGELVGVPDLALRAGVLTGEAAVTVGAAGQGMVAGDLVNTASRLQSAADAGTVLVGRTTRNAASMAISFEEVGDKQLKGKELPVAAWRAVRVIAGRGGAGRYTGLEPPFEGRDEQLRLIKELFHATARERRSRLITVIGQAGTGKSRLIREFEKYTDGLDETIYWHIGRSPAYGEGVSFWALGEMVRKRAGLVERDDEQTTRQRIAAALDEFVPDESERRWIAPRLLQLLGIGEARGGEREELFAAWRTFFERVADGGPTVMAFEDLENADPGLLDFIDHLVEWSKSYPILVIALARPEMLERRPNWGAGQRSYASIGLEPLTDEAMRHALAGLVPGLPEPAVKAILSRAEGVPLYAVETVRMLLNEGRLKEEDGVYQPVGDLTALEVPNTLHALIAARLDALDPADRSVLQDAAVLGHTFTLAALAAVSGQAAEAVEPRLRSLVRREVLELNVDPRSPERGQYGFVQGLLREVAYSTLSKKDRRTRHLAAARYFEALGEEELAGALARHYLDAWRATAAGAEADAIAAQARVALRAAAERATALHDYAQALAFLEHLLGVSTDEGEKAAVLERAALAAESAGRAATAVPYAEQAMELYRAAGDRSGVARTLAAVGRSLLMQSKLEEGIERLERELPGLGDADDDPATVEAISVLARIKSLHNEDEEAIRLSERALVAAERLDMIEVIAATVMTKAVSLSYLRRNREASILLPGVLQLAETHGLVTLELRARLNLSQFAFVDEPRLTLSVARVGFERARKLGLRFWEMLLGGNALMGALHVGDWDWAIETASELLGDTGMDDVNDEMMAYVTTMGALRGDGGQRLTDVVRVYEEFVEQSNDPQYPDLLQDLRIWLSLVRGEVRRAAELATERTYIDPTYGSVAVGLGAHAALWLRDIDLAHSAEAAFAGLGVRGRWLDSCRRVLDGGIAGLEGRRAEADALFVESVGTLRDDGVMFDVALCLMDQVATLGVADDAGRAAADEARQILERLGASVLVQRLEALVDESARDSADAKQADAAKVLDREPVAAKNLPS